MARIRLLCALTTTIFAFSAHARMGAVGDEEFSPMYPRFVFSAGMPLQLERRQAHTAECGAGQHSCRAVNVTGCCPNTNYCYVNTAFAGKCCDDSTTCDDNPCPLSQYRCIISATTTCCDRACPTNAFQCASSLGNGCCSVGSVCVQNNLCSSTTDPKASTAVTATPTPSISGCNAGQTSCAVSLGGGCCNSGDVCTNFGSILACGTNAASSSFTARAGGAVNTGIDASGTSLPTTGTGGGGLSTGAKAGIGAGAAIGALALLAITWFIITHRRTAQVDVSVSGPSRRPTMMSQFGYQFGSQHGRAQSQSDYFGQRGPHSEQEEGTASGYASSPGAVPLSPHGPGDITRPVEIAEGETTKPPVTRTEPVELP